MLQVSVLRLAQSETKGVRNEQRPRRFHFLNVLAHHGKADGDETRGLEDPGQHTDRVRAQRSSRGQKNNLGALGLEPLRNLRARVFLDAPHVTEGAHERIAVRCHAADHAPCGQLAYPV